MKEIVIKRDYYLDLLDKNTASFRKGVGKNIALLGPRKSGKTLIVREHLKNAKEVIPVYIDLEKISLNPENFCIEFIGNVIFHYLKRPLSEYREFLLLDRLLKIEKELNSKNSFPLVKTIENELLKIKPDQKMLVQAAFNFAPALAKDSGKRFLVVLDNFENLLGLNNFTQIKDVISIINLEADGVSYIATSSAIRQSLALLKKFECYEIKNLDRKESFELTESIIGKNDKANEEIFRLSSGHPLISILISNKYKEIKDVKRAFLIELLTKDSAIYSYCNDSYNYYYSRARGQTLLKTILKVIANEELRLSEIAKKIYRSAPVTKSIIERLMEADVICKKGNKFCFADNVLGLWLKLISRGYEFDELPDDKMLDEVAKQL